MKHAWWVMGIILLVTLFFCYTLKDLRIDTNIFSFAGDVPAAPINTTPSEKPKDRLILKGINGDMPFPNKGEIVQVPNRANTFSETEFENTIPFEEVEPILNPYSEEKTGSFPDGYVIVFTSEDLYTPEVLNEIYSVMMNLENRYEIGPVLSPFDYVTVEKKGTRLSIVPIAPVKRGELWTEEDIELFKERLLKDSVAKDYLYSSDGNTIMIYYRARGLNSDSIRELDTIVNPLRKYGRLALNGGGLITDAVMKYINRDLILLICLSFIVILTIFYLSFHSLRAVLIPAVVSLVGLIWTLGTMTLMGYKLTIVTILTPVLVLTLGSSYSVHMLSEYFETVNEHDEERLNEHFSRISKTIFFAMLTTVVGFLALLICRTKLFRELGITISIGIFFCWFLSFTLLPAILAKSRLPKPKTVKKIEYGLLSKVVNGTARAIVRFWWIPLIVLVLVFIWFLFIENKIGFDSNYMSYFPDNDPIAIDSKYFAKTLGGTDPYYLYIYAPKGEDKFFLKAENLKDVYAYEQTIKAADPDIVQVLSFSQYVSFLNEVYNGESGIPDNNGLILLLSRTLQQIKGIIGSDVLDMLITEDGNTITLSMRNYDYVEQDLQTTASARRLNQTLDYYLYMLPEGTTSQVGSLAATNLRGSDIIMEDQTKATWLSMILIFIIASIACLSILYGVSTLFPVSVGVMIIYILMWCIGMNFDIVTVGFSSIAIGCGVDDAIHFMLRLKNRRKILHGHPYRDIVFANIIETGKPIILTTVSIDAGLLMLLFASFKPIKYFGVLMFVALSAAMIATLTILPAILIFFDKIRDFLKKKK